MSVLLTGGGGRALDERVARILKLPFPLLVDPDRAVYRQLGFDRRVAGLIQQSGWVLIDRDGVVRYVHRSTMPAAALDMNELWAALDQLGATKP